MALHLTKDSMKFESLIEMIKVAQYCINFNKKPDWGYEGCYGYPAALLLLCIVDAIGAHVKGGGDDMKIHFTILNDPQWFDFKLNEIELEGLRKSLRNRLAHQAYIDEDIILSKGSFEDSAVSTNNQGLIVINLVPFFEKAKFCVEKCIKTLNLKIVI